MSSRSFAAPEAVVTADTVFAALSQSVLLLDAEWRIRWVSPRVERHLGRSPADLAGADFWEHIGCGLPDALQERYRRVVATGCREAFTAPFGAAGQWYEVELDPLPSGLLVLTRDITDARQIRLNEQRLQAEQAVLARVAHAVARAVQPERVVELVCEELGALLRVDFVGVGRTAGRHRCEVVASWSIRHGVGRGLGYYELAPGDEFSRLERSRAPIWSSRAEGTMSRYFLQLGLERAYSVPIRVGGRFWGMLLAGAKDPEVLDDAAAHRLEDLCDLLGLAFANAQAQEELLRRATSDSLTGLLNHRTFHERLEEARRRATTTGTALSLALFDLDAFRAVNEAFGHAMGDRLLKAAADALQATVSADGTVSRLGGDEFAMILPSRGAEAARPVVDAARQAMAEAARGVVDSAVSVSAGICDVARAADVGQLYDLADGALYWAKHHGRDATCVFDPLVVQELNAEERVAVLERGRVLSTITALARAIDAKDPATHRHAERVAALAVAVATRLGRPPGEVDLLEQAALVHDVGKIGVPDAVLLKPGELGADELRQMRGHAELGSRMVEGVLGPEQVRWIRGHHERPDGQGYPDGLRGEDLSLGAGILALCDAFDVMVAGRPYQVAVPAPAAVAECSRLADHQFLPEAVVALRALLLEDALPPLA